MLAIEVELLTGRYVASAHDDRRRHEWPPHPSRLFSAMVAEWGSANAPDAEERRVLETVEQFGAPEIRASAASRRSVVTHYVPVNDATVIGAGPNQRARKLDEAFAVLADPASTSRQRTSAERVIAKQRDVGSLVSGAPNQSDPLPTARKRQARYYPSVTPEQPRLTYQWPAAELDTADTTTLDGLLARVTRLGHSSSLVSCRVIEPSEPPTYVPDIRGSQQLRTVGPGQLTALVSEFERHQGSQPRSLPASVTAYAAVGERSEDVPRTPSPLVPTTAGEWIVFEVDSTGNRSRRPHPRSIVDLTTALRGAVLKHAEQPIPEELSGHAENGSITHRPHVAFLALPDVGYEWAHGGILGVAVALPVGIEPSARRAVLQAIGRWEQAAEQDTFLNVSGGRRWRARRLPMQGEQPNLVALRDTTWGRRRRGALAWVSATPVALPWRSGRGRRRMSEWDLAEEWVGKACHHVGLSAPALVSVSTAPVLLGTLPADRYPAFRQGGIARRLVHVRVEFDQPITGPFVLGSGRFRGLGLMRPVDPPSEDGRDG